MSEIGNYLVEKIGKEYFTEKKVESSEVPALAENNGKRIVIGIIRETIGPFINRSSIPDETITFRIDNNNETRDVVEIPARKFKSKEKLLGTRLCRLYGVMDKNVQDRNRKYRYNSLSSVEMLKNPVSGIFGDTVVSGDTAGQGMFPSRVLYSSSYSIRDRSLITNRLTHNSLSYNGTMWDQEEGKNRQSLFETEYVIPGVYFPSFLTLVDPTPETLFFILETLHENSYGAQTSITGTNFRNNIIFLTGCDNEPPISSYEISRDLNTNKIDYQTLKSFILDKLSSVSNKNSKIITGEDLNSILEFLDHTNFDQKQNALEKLNHDVGDLWSYSNFGKKNKSRKNKAKDEPDSDNLEEE
jgi:CRISPR-associated protein Csc2